MQVRIAARSRIPRLPAKIATQENLRVELGFAFARLFGSCTVSRRTICTEIWKCKQREGAAKGEVTVYRLELAAELARAHATGKLLLSPD